MATPMLSAAISVVLPTAVEIPADLTGVYLDFSDDLSTVSTWEPEIAPSAGGSGMEIDSLPARIQEVGEVVV